MIAKIREILLTQYIGSILIALLLLQAAIEVVLRIVRIGFWLFGHSRTESVMSGNSRGPFAWDGLIFSAVTAVLYVLTAYGLARWLFPTVDASANKPQSAEPREQRS